MSAFVKIVLRCDHGLMRRVHAWKAPRWVRSWMIAATWLGDGWIWYALLLTISLTGGSGRFLAVRDALAAGISSRFIYHGVRRYSRRRRPCAIHAHCWAMMPPPDEISFPSGHTLTAFAIAIPIGIAYPSLMIALLFCAASIAASRIVLGMHFLSDVIAGGLMGAALGFSAALLLN
jgi:undecaprenyl-diphosphatase